MTQPGLFDLPEGKKRGKAGGKLAAEAAAVTVWREHAETVLTMLARSGHTFTADDLIKRVGLPHAPKPYKNGAVGGLFSAAAGRGEIVSVGFVPTARIIGHARPIRLWRGV